MDKLTIASIISDLVVIGIVIFATWYNHNMTKKRLHKITKATMALQANQDEQMLCRAIKEIDPLACPLLDYTIETKDGKTRITEWTAKRKKPGKKELRQILEELKRKEENSV